MGDALTNEKYWFVRIHTCKVIGENISTLIDEYYSIKNRKRLDILYEKYLYLPRKLYCKTYVADINFCTHISLMWGCTYAYKPGIYAGIL